MTESTAFVLLDEVQARVLGCLIEKALTTPEAYPLTLNALAVGCNQKTSRDPVMELELGSVGHAVRQLEDRGIVRVVHGARSLRYEHRFDEAFTVTPRQRAVLCLLMLRGAQTLGELHARSERLVPMPSLDDVRDTVDRLAARTPALLLRLPRGPGQREDRYAHLLCGEHAARSAPVGSADPVGAGGHDALLARIEALEARVAALESGRSAPEA